jgi:RNA polymerase sigma-70 factor (ECF subfamily)
MPHPHDVGRTLIMAISVHSLEARTTGSEVSPAAEEFEQLMRRTYNYAYSAAYRMMGNSADAEDLTQEAFVRIWAAFDRYNRARSFEGWLFRTLYNLAIDRWRRISRIPVCSLDGDISQAVGKGCRRSGSRTTRDNGVPLLNYLADDRISVMPEEAYLRTENGRSIRRALSKLPFDYRKAVVLADVQGYSYEEIARYVGCPVGTIRSRLHRGRELLRQTIRTMREEEMDEDTGSARSRSLSQ